MVSIKIHGGKDEIGGNKILVEHKGTKIMLDFGMSFKQSGLYFSEFLKPRKCVALKDFFELGLLPDINGIYREDYLKQMEKPEEEKGIDAVFLTHAHADHAQYIHFLRNDIPIYCTNATEIILGVLEETGRGDYSDLITACEAFTFYTNAKGGLSRVTRKKEEFVKTRIFNIMETEKKVKIGSMEIEMVPVDHSLPGSCAFIINTDEGNIVYTGDIRFHGSNQQSSKDFVEKAKEANPNWLICEGTRIGEDKQDNEEGVRNEMSKLIKDAKGLVFIEHPIRDLDRVVSIFEAAKSNKKQFVVNLKLAYLIQSLGDLCPFKLDDVKIFVPRKSWGLICKSGTDEKLVNADYSKWEIPFLRRDNSITYTELQKNQIKYVVSMSIWEINQLTDIRPKDAIWIKSSCEPFCDEMEIDEERKKHWLEHFNIKEYSAHASGHASGIEIMEMIKEIKPKNLIPVHTEKKSVFNELKIPVLVGVNST